jgi:hypothetical protein
MGSGSIAEPGDSSHWCKDKVVVHGNIMLYYWRVRKAISEVWIEMGVKKIVVTS